MKTLVKYKANIGLVDSLNIGHSTKFYWYGRFYVNKTSKSVRFLTLPNIEVMKDFNIYEILNFDPNFDNKERIVRMLIE